MIRQGRIDWNDSVSDFITVKVKRPEVLAELIRREKQCVEKWSCEKKIEQERNQYERLAAAFRSDQQEFEQNMAKKRHFQKEISRLQNEVVRMQFDLVKFEGQEKFLSKTKQEDKASSQYLHNLRSNESIYQSERESMMTQYGCLKEMLNRQMQELVAKRVELKEDLSNLQLQHNKLNEQFNFETQLIEVEQQVIKMEKQLKKQRKLKSELLEMKNQVDLSILVDKKNREATRLKVEQNSKRLRDFGKDSKKILIGNDGIGSKKYMQFVKKYKTNTRQDELRLKNKLASLKQNQDNPYNKKIFREVDNRLEKLRETITGIMDSSDKKKFTNRQFQELQQKCGDIMKRQAELMRLEPLLSRQVQALQENLQRKTRQLQREMARLNRKPF